jgi:cullin 4
MSPAEYIAHVDSRLRQEDQRCDRFFERGSKKEIMTVVQYELIGRISEEILKKGFTSLVKENDTDSLRTLYQLLNLVDDIEIMRVAWANYVKVSLPISVPVPTRNPPC